MQVSPITAAGMMGSDNALDTQMTQQKLADLIQAHAQADQMNPLLLDKQRLANQTTEAELPGVVADSGKKGVDYQIAQQTMSGTIQGTNAKNQLEVLKQQDAQREQFQNILMEGASALQGVAGPMQGTALRAYLQQNGINPDTPIAQSWISNAVNSGNASGWLQARAGELAKIRAQQNPTAYAHMYGSDATSSATVQAANAHAGATRYAADRAYDARTEVQAAKNEAIMARQQTAKTYQQQAIMLDNAAEAEPDPNKKLLLKARAKRYRDAALQITPQGSPKPDVSSLTSVPNMPITDPFADEVQSPGAPPATPPGTPPGVKPAPVMGRTSSGASYRIIQN
jgi:hypothetical protein